MSEKLVRWGQQNGGDGWRKSSHSVQDGCVEVGVARTSSYTNGSTCVEVEGLPEGGVAVRDSKDPAGPVLRFNPNEWTAFLKGVRDGEFDLDREPGDAILRTWSGGD